VNVEDFPASVKITTYTFFSRKVGVGYKYKVLSDEMDV
jgi:hypothetical protein